MESYPYLLLDPYLIWFFRLTGRAGVDFFLGTLAVASLALLAGKLSSYLASFLVRRPLEQVAGEAKKYHQLSLEALKTGDRPAYEAANQLANEAYSKSFFQQVALSAAFFWPVFFALGWMSIRFGEVTIPLPFSGLSIGYPGVFLPLYVAVYIIVKKVKSRIRPRGRSAPERAGMGEELAAGAAEASKYS